MTHRDLFDSDSLLSGASMVNDEIVSDEEEATSAVDVCSIWVSMPNGEQLHLRHFKPSIDASNVSQSGRSIFMLHGEVECGRVFYDNHGQGMAWHFVNQGHEVFVADLGGRGRSLSPGEDISSLSVRDIIVDAIPRFLQAAHNNSIWQQTLDCSSPKGPTTWVGHGFGAVILAAAWARLDSQWQAATQMVFIAGRRRLEAKQRLSKLFVQLFCHPFTQKLITWKNFLPATRLGLGTADESAGWYRSYVNWMHNKEWLCDEDGFDYAAGLRRSPLPATLHFATVHDVIYSNVQDIRNFVQEVGQHDARLIVLDRIGTSKRCYNNHLAMLLDSGAVEDVFKPISNWLDAYNMPEDGWQNESLSNAALYESQYNHDSQHTSDENEYTSAHGKQKIPIFA